MRDPPCVLSTPSLFKDKMLQKIKFKAMTYIEGDGKSVTTFCRAEIEFQFPFQSKPAGSWVRTFGNLQDSSSDTLTAASSSLHVALSYFMYLCQEHILKWTSTLN